MRTCVSILRSAPGVAGWGGRFAGVSPGVFLALREPWREVALITKMTRAPLLALALAGCASVNDPSSGVICTMQAVSSLNVTVRDQATSQRICDAAVIAMLDGTPYAVRPAGPPEACTYAGPEERAGTFTVQASKTGYESASAGNVRVTADECHVIPVQLTIDLRKSGS
jgi:hypothetical protein